MTDEQRHEALHYRCPTCSALQARWWSFSGIGTIDGETGAVIVPAETLAQEKARREYIEHRRTHERIISCQF